jgi:hypothetical protein
MERRHLLPVSSSPGSREGLSWKAASLALWARRRYGARVLLAKA